jgi:hypothetical protein
MITRQEYMLSSKDLHAEYYLQFSNQNLESLVLGTFGLTRLAKSYRNDKHLNNIPLAEWDRLEPFARMYVSKKLLKDLSETWSLATSICVLKNIAISAISH